MSLAPERSGERGDAIGFAAPPQPATRDDTAALAAALRKSWAAVEQLGEQAAAYFYAALFTLEPGLREMFPAAMGAQRNRLLAALGHIVSRVDDGPALTAFAEQLGRDHRRFEVRPEHYPVVGQALLHTLAHNLGAAWTPELAQAWANAYEKVSSAMIEAAARSAQREPARWEAQIVSHERRTGDIAVITARVPDRFQWRAGQSVAVESHLRPRVWRYLSPANSPRGEGTMEFHVRAMAGGQLSPALVYQAQSGDILHLSAPIGTGLTLPAGPGPDLLLLAGGTGLAPLKAIVDQMGRAPDGRRVTLIVGAAWRHELYDLASLQGFATRQPWLTLLVSLSSDPSLGQPLTVAEAAVRHGNWHDRLIYVCGSPAMVQGTRQVLAAHRYAPAQIRVENFDGTTYAPLQDESSQGELA